LKKNNQIIINKLRNTIILGTHFKIFIKHVFRSFNSSDHAIHSTWTVKYYFQLCMIVLFYLMLICYLFTRDLSFILSD